MANTRDRYASHDPVDFAAAGQDAISMVSSLYTICRGTQVKGDGLPGHHVSQATNRHFPCGPSGYQSKGCSPSNQTYLIFGFVVFRRCQRIVPGSANLSI